MKLSDFFFHLVIKEEEPRGRAAKTIADRGAQASPSKGMGEGIRRVLKEMKKHIRAGVRKRYTYKGAIGIKMQMYGQSGRLLVSGARNPLSKFYYNGFSARPHRPYLRAIFVRGESITFRRAFENQEVGAFFERVSKPRLPIRKIMGPSTAEMAGHEPEPAGTIRRVMDEKIKKYADILMERWIGPWWV